jgi:hypothetical protein
MTAFAKNLLVLGAGVVDKLWDKAGKTVEKSTIISG